MPLSSLCVGVSPTYKDFFLPSRTSEPAVGLAVSLPLSVLKPHWICSFIPSVVSIQVFVMLYVSWETELNSGEEKELTGKIRTGENWEHGGSGS